MGKWKYGRQTLECAHLTWTMRGVLNNFTLIRLFPLPPFFLSLFYLCVYPPSFWSILWIICSTFTVQLRFQSFWSKNLCIATNILKPPHRNQHHISFLYLGLLSLWKWPEVLEKAGVPLCNAHCAVKATLCQQQYTCGPITACADRPQCS